MILDNQIFTQKHHSIMIKSEQTLDCLSTPPPLRPHPLAKIKQIMHALFVMAFFFFFSSHFLCVDILSSRDFVGWVYHTQTCPSVKRLAYIPGPALADLLMVCVFQ